MKTAVINALLWGILLAIPGEAWSQDGAETSVWQFGLRDVGWEAVERLQEEIRDYREAGAIGSFEVRIRTNKTRLDATVTADIVDAVKLADLRGFDRPEQRSGVTIRPGGIIESGEAECRIVPSTPPCPQISSR